MDLGIPKFIDVLDYFPPDEGSINQYYGIIGSGKTYAATADLINDLNNGQVVYANWRVNWDGYDERKSKFKLFLALIGLKKEFIVFPKENFHFISTENFTIEFSGTLNDCKIYWDEGHLILNSYEKTSVDIRKLALIYHTRHYDRTINIISQRPTAIHVSARANVNRFFKCEKVWDIFFTVFKKTEIQTTTNDDRPDEEQEVGSEYYLGRKRIFLAYNTKYLRGGAETSQKNLAQIFLIGVREAWRGLFNFPPSKLRSGAGRRPTAEGGRNGLNPGKEENGLSKDSTTHFPGNPIR